VPFTLSAANKPNYAECRYAECRGTRGEGAWFIVREKRIRKEKPPQPLFTFFVA
jgi:hypothetical protein